MSSRVRYHLGATHNRENHYGPLTAIIYCTLLRERRQELIRVFIAILVLVPRVQLAH